MSNQKGILERASGDHSIRNRISEETDPIKRIGLVLKDHVPVGVTSFYLTFFAAAKTSGSSDAEFVQFNLLPILSLLATVALSFVKSWDKTKRKLDWWGMLIPPFALIGWIYVTGGRFFNFALSPLIAAIAFAFLGLIVPALYALVKN